MNSNYPAQPTAQGLASLGRNQDTMLMHVTPNEVAGLQQLAMAQGGSLTINPHTGLPEAGFFNDLIGFAAPIAAGFALGPGGFGLFTGANAALYSGLAVGGLTALASGDIMKGLGAGLGAYGGAGLGGNLAGYGAEIAKTPTIAPITEAVAPGVTGGSTAGLSTLGEAGVNAPTSLFSNTVASVPDVGSTAFFKGTPSTAAELASNTGGGSFLGKSITPPSGFDNVKTGVGNILSPEKGSLSYTDYLKGQDKSLWPDVMTVGAPFAQAALNQPIPTIPYETESYDYGGPYVPSDRRVSMPTAAERKDLGSKEYLYFDPTNPVPGYRSVNQYADGGEVEYEDNPIGYAHGGIVQYADNNIGYAEGGDIPSVNDATSVPTTSEQDYKFKSLSSDIPSTMHEQALADWEQKVKDAMGPFGGGKGGGKGGSVNTFFGGNQNVPPGHLGVFQQLYGRLGRSKADVEAMVGPKPVWDPTNPMSNVPDIPTVAAASGGYLSYADGGEIPTIPNMGESNYGINQLGGIAGTSNRDLMLNNINSSGINPLIAKLLESVLQNNPSAFAEDATPTPTPSVNAGPKYMPEATQASIASPMAREQKQFTDIPKVNAATGGIIGLTQGGKSTPGGYLDGKGDGMSDSIHATIANKQPARLADGEFVVPADVVSHIGNGSSKAGAKRLYSMMSKVRTARTGSAKQGKQINPNKYLPA